MPTLNIDIEARFAQFLDALNGMEREAAKTAKNISASFELVKSTIKGLAAGFTVHAFVDMIDGSIEAAGRLHELAQQTGVTVETLSALKLVAKQSGTDLESVAGLVNKLEKNMLSFAQDGGGKAAKAFQQLGISQEQVRAGLKDMDNFLPQFAKKLVETGQGGEQAGLAMQLIGKGAGAALPFLNQLIENGPLKPIITAKQAEEADRFKDSMAALASKGEEFRNSLAFKLLPTLNDIADAMLEARKAGDGFFGSVFEGAKKAAQKLLGFTDESALNSVSEKIVDITGKLSGLEDAQSKGAKGLANRIVKTREELAELVKKRDLLEKIIELNRPEEVVKKPNKALDDLPKETKDVADNDSAWRSLIKTLKELTLAEDEKTQVRKTAIIIEEMSQKQRDAGSAAQKAEVMRLAELADKQKIAKTALEAYVKAEEDFMATQREALKAETDIQDKRGAAIQAAQKNLEQIEFETTLIGLGNVERELSIRLHELEAAGITKESNEWKLFAEEFQNALRLKEISTIKDEEFKKSQKDTAKEITEFWKKAAHEIEASLSGLFFDVMQGNLKSLSGSFKKTLDKMVADVLAAKAATALFGEDFGKGGDIGGWVKKGLGLFGIGEEGATANMGMDWAGAFATGTDFVPRTGLALIHRGERIIPAEKNTMGGASGATVHMTVVTPDAGSFRRSRSQVAGDMYTALAVAQRNR